MTKRKQVKQACANCQRACKKCDDVRPCQRCIKLGMEESCFDTLRKRDLKHVLAAQEEALPAPRSVRAKPNLPAPTPIMKYPIANLDTLAMICSDEFLKGGQEDFMVSEDSLSRIHTHRMLSDFTPFPGKPPTPPPSPFPSFSGLGDAVALKHPESMPDLKKK